MIENTRTIEELVALYTLEDEIFDLYVEGITDKLLFDNYNKYKTLEIKIVEIDTLDFTGIEFTDLDYKSNKDKLVTLSRIFTENNICSKVLCLVDNDFDGILKEREKNDFLIRTDFSCIESYFLCTNIIQKFVDIAIRKFPFDISHLINEIGKALKGLFIIRLIKLKFNLNCNLLKIENNINICKKSGCVGFDFQDYFEKFILANSLKGRKQEFLNFANEIEIKLSLDIRNTLNGHDFMEVLYLYINKIKPSTGFKQETFEKAFLVSLQPDHFDSFPLFKKLA